MPDELLIIDEACPLAAAPGEETRTTEAFARQNRALSLLASGEPFDDVLAELCRAAEALETGATAAILVLDRERHCFDRAIAPSLPPDFAAALAGAPVGPPHLGTCAAAIFRGETVTCTDVATDARWDPRWRALNLGHEIRASQSTPIIGSDGRALGTFALFFSEPCPLDAWNEGRIRLTVQFAALALEKTQAVAELKALNLTLERRVADHIRERDQHWALSEDLLAVADYDGHLLRASPSWSRLLGHDQATLLSQPYGDLIHRGDLAAVMAEIAAMRAERRPIRCKCRLRAADGSYRWIAWTLSPEPDAPRFHGVGRDVTAETQAAEALRRTEEQLRQAQKVEALGRLTGGVAHDFNNILSAILGNLELFEHDLRDDRLRRLAQAATRAAQRGAKLTEQLLVFSRKHQLTAQAIDLNAAVSGMADMLRRTLGGNTEIHPVLAATLWPALVDPTQFEVALLNLAINARDAMDGIGTIRIATRNLASGDPDLPADLTPGDYVAVAVTDAGNGMSEDTLSKALEPFFTTKAPGKGTGLGLSQVYGLTKQSGGDIRIRSALGRGTTVELFLPRALTEIAADAPLAADPANDPSNKRTTILVVDDQEDVREVAVAYLDALGYPTLQASNGKSAVDLLESDGAAAVDLLLVDYAMPGLSGVEVALAARAKRPDLPVIIATGYADSSLATERLDGALLLRKPYRLHDLETAIDAVLSWRERLPSNIVALRQERA